MQYIQETCLLNFIKSSIFNGKEREPFVFNWDLIKQNKVNFKQAYNQEDAKFLLQLSLMTSQANYLNEKLDFPPELKNIELNYDYCPINLVSELLPKSKLNKSTLICHVLYNKTNNLLYIIFTGTINKCMALVDMTYKQRELEDILNYLPGLKGHGGIYEAYLSVRQKLVTILKEYLPNKPQIIITGHSLGGGLSQYCALDLAYYNPIHYSFASPMVFNEIGYQVFNKLVKYSFRIANLSDLVTMTPLPIMPNNDVFFHVGQLISFQDNLGEYPLNHTEAYLMQYKLI